MAFYFYACLYVIPIIVVLWLVALLATGASLKISQFMYHAETKSSKRSKSKPEEKAQVLLVPRVIFAWLSQHPFFVVLWIKVQTSHIPYLSSQGKMSVSH